MIGRNGIRCNVIYSRYVDRVDLKIIKSLKEKQAAQEVLHLFLPGVARVHHVDYCLVIAMGMDHVTLPPGSP